MLSLYEILKASKTGIAPDMWTALAGKNWGGADSGHEVKELTGIPPLSFRADGTPLLDYLIKGNTVQNGTPTPSNPIQPQGTGERTAQLFDKNNANIYNAYINTSHEWILSESAKTVKIQCEPNTVYTLSVSSTLSVFRIYENPNENIAPTESGVVLTPILRGENKTQYTFTTSSTAKVLIFQGSSSDYNMWFNSLMLNSGSTALPYEPYGYKIPISNGSVTTNVYLGEVQTVRNLKKRILTGEETYIRINNDYTAISGNIASRNWHSTISTCGGINSSNSGNKLWILNSAFSSYTTAEAMREYFAQQYASGNPVTVWYVLASPETGVVNEPLMKMGDYADTVSMEQTGASIPTASGANVIDVETTVKPSEMYIKYQE